MPKISGVFEEFENLDQIPINDIYRWLKVTLPKNSQVPSMEWMENFLANHILYPQTIAVSALDQAVTLSLLREALRKNPRPFLDIVNRKISIPESFLTVCDNLSQLAYVFVDAFLLNSGFGGVWGLFLNGEQQEVLGSVLLPEFDNSLSVLEVFLEGQQVSIKKGQFALMPCQKLQCIVGFKSTSKAGVEGKNEGVIPTYGGKLGVLIDGRRA